jgi:hypothetical protein
MARDLASMGKEIEQLKAGRELVARDDANVSELARGVVPNNSRRARNKWRVTMRTRRSKSRQSRINWAALFPQASEHNAPPRVAAASPPPAAPVMRKPVPLLSSPQATGQPTADKPKLSSTSRPPAPPAPAR